MEIIYTSHLEFRMKIRNIPYDLPKELFNKAREHYYDNLTKHYVAIHQVEFEGKFREMIVIYDRERDKIEIITIHPVRPYQRISRINSGRWRKK